MKRTGNHSHYENAVEAYFIEKKISYMAVNEGKKVLANNQKVKNFDFLINSKKSVIALDVKGKQFGYDSAPSNLWENWIMEQDITSLENWKKEFKKSGVNIEPIFMYAYLLRNKDQHSTFKITYKFKGKTYGLVGISLKDYKKNLKVRSNSPKSVCVSRKVFAEITKPINHFL